MPGAPLNMSANSKRHEASVILRDDLQKLVDALAGAGFDVIGPRIRDGAVMLQRLSSVEQLPAGWTDAQGSGTYRLEWSGRAALFEHVLGPASWKQFLHPSSLRLFSAERRGGGFDVAEDRAPARPFAFFGVRPCDLSAIAVQDRVFLGEALPDGPYGRRRQGVFVVAVNCTRPGGACFCASMRTGPRASTGYDIALTEVAKADAHHFVAEAGTPRGAEMLARVPARRATEEQVREAGALLAAAAKRMGRTLETAGLKEALYLNLEHPRWNDVAARCLACANCTMVCPTCFCSTVEETTDLAGRTAERWRKWDSCFTQEFSYIHGGSVRTSVRARYRQWLTHKLASWLDQFGTCGCVGCGRCIAWCPAGIDITEEAKALRGATAAQAP
jgi:formate hydrogenlyase subunit 6/NADH:ubiquinone oxidoreductase subunit I